MEGFLDRLHTHYHIAVNILLREDPATTVAANI